MKKQRSPSVRRPVLRAISVVFVSAVVLGLTGCNGEQMTRIDEQQTQLQMMVKANSLQIEDMTARLEKNQKQMNVLIESIQNNVAQVALDVVQVADDVAAVANAQATLRDAMLSSSRQVAEKIDAFGQNQEDMSASLNRAISGVQSETGKVAADLTAVAADVTAISGEQAKLFETVQKNNRELTGKVAAIEQMQQERQNAIGGMEDNINTLAAGISGLGQDVLRLQEILQSNIRELVSIAEISGQKQDEFQQSIQNSLRTLDDSFTSLKANQNDLQSRIEQMRNQAPDLSSLTASFDQMKEQLDGSFASLTASQNELQSRIDRMQNEAADLRDMPAAIDQLKDQLEELSRSRLSGNAAEASGYETSADAYVEPDHTQ